MELAFLVLGVILLAASIVARRRARSIGRRGLRIGVRLLTYAVTLVALPSLAFGGYRFWRNHRPTPEDVQVTLFEGIHYAREVRHGKRTQIIHVVTIDLHAPGIGFLVTPRDPGPGLPLRARKTSAFLTEFGVQLAINGDMFTPWTYEPFSYYPHVNDPVTPSGIAISRGVPYGTPDPARPTLYLSATNEASFRAPVGEAFNAISGNCLFVEAGAVAIDQTCHAVGPWIRHPRSAVAIDKEGRRLILIVIDGRQSAYSAGATLEELAEVVLASGGFTALNLDGGGSTELVSESTPGTALVMNSPVHHPLFGAERPIANHLGVFARRP